MVVLIVVLVLIVVVAVTSGTLFVTGRVSRRGRPETSAPAPVARVPVAPVLPPVPEDTEVEQPDGTEADTATGEADTGTSDTGTSDLPVDLVESDVATLTAPPRFRDRLGKARSLFGGYLGAVRSRDRIDGTTWDELEEALILADVGLDVTTAVLDDLRRRVRSEKIESPALLLDALKAELIQVLEGDRELHFATDATTVWLVVGVNGVGKTTTIGKIGRRQRVAGHTVVMAAGDTFRAAAADQLAAWASRVDAEVIRGNEGGDPGAVIFDAVQHAAARGTDLVLADTAGRLHTKVNLMEELKKVRRVAERPPGQVTEVLLVIDATTGQNGLVQAKQFTAAVEVTGVVLTKLDGTAKGGIAVAIAGELGIPIKLVGLGEGADDLIDFDAVEFVEALFSEE
jgi:fused signal recognition particle receptor